MPGPKGEGSVFNFTGWAQEGYNITKHFVYDHITEYEDLPEWYIDAGKQLADMRIAEAGVRMAEVLKSLKFDQYIPVPPGPDVHEFAAVASTELAASNKERARKIEETMFVAMFVVAVCLFLYLYSTGKAPQAEVVEKKKVEAQAQKNSKYAALTKDTEIELEEVSIDVEEPQIKKL